MENNTTAMRSFTGNAMASALASVCMAALLVPTAQAQTAPATAPAPGTVAAADAGTNQPGIEEILVTARRQSESLLNVPESIQVVTGAALQKLAITQATEISKLAPGLTLATDGESTGTKIVLRGIAWQPGSGTPATPTYINEVPFDPFRAIQSVFDIGQIEVLRGPQGTSRGAPSISGAITITTKKPDLDTIGGYVQGQYGEGNHTDFQGALNIPVIKDMLAFRGAFNIEDSYANRVFSVNSSIKPKYRNRAYRLTALFTPTDTVTVEAMVQHSDQLTQSYIQVVGTGSPGAPALGIPANFNGPALGVKDRKSVQGAPQSNPSNFNFITLNASWNVLGQKLTYNYGRATDASGPSTLAMDPVNMLPGYDPVNVTTNASAPFYQTHEIHLSSVPAASRVFDYDVGWFSKHSRAPLNFAQPVFYLGGLGGAFGAPGTLPGAVTTPDDKYVLHTSTDIGIDQYFDSFYGNVRIHIDSKTELSGGVAAVRDRVPVTLNITTGGASLVATPQSALGGLPCAGIPGVFVTGLVNSDYAGYCDKALPVGVGDAAPESFNNTFHRVLYNASISHKFTSDVMAYATTGTSYRSGLPAIDNTGLPSNLFEPLPETATSYEVGVKTTIQRKLHVSADVFQINYKNQLTAFPNVPYFNTTSGSVTETSDAFYSNINARVRGAELEIAARPLRDLSLGASVSYSRIASRGGLIPCSNASGPAITAANPINYCTSQSGQTLNTQAPFQATLNGSYDVPLTSNWDGYLRFNMNFQGTNPNFGNYPVASGFTETSSYAIFDLFAGLTGSKTGWDIGVYAKNAFNVKKELNRSALLNTIYAPFAAAPSGYAGVSTTLPREIGVTLRIPFGSR